MVAIKILLEGARWAAKIKNKNNKVTDKDQPSAPPKKGILDKLCNFFGFIFFMSLT